MTDYIVGSGAGPRANERINQGSTAVLPLGRDRALPDQTPLAVTLNMDETLVPRMAMAAMQMTAMSASKRQYSASEAPSSSRISLVEAVRNLVMDLSLQV